MQSAAAILIAPGLSDLFFLKHLHRHCIQVTQQPQRRQLLSRRALEFRQLKGIRGDACAVGSDSCVVCLNSYKLVLELCTCSGDSSGAGLAREPDRSDDRANAGLWRGQEGEGRCSREVL